MAYIATHQGRQRRVQVTARAPGRFQVVLGGPQEREGTAYEVDFLEPQPNLLSLIIGGRSFEVDVDPVEGGDGFHIVIQGDPYEVEVVEEKQALKRAGGLGGRQGIASIPSPMAGHVRQVLVRPGQRVAAGQVLLTLEAMKMENELKSPILGVVRSVTAREGVAVSSGDLLCVVEPLEP